MSDTALREALRAIVDPAMFDGNYVRSDWLPRWREAHDHARRLLDIPAEPEQADEVAGLDVERLRDDMADCLHVAMGAAHPRHPRARGGACQECSDNAAMLAEIAVARLAPARDDGGAS